MRVRSTAKPIWYGFDYTHCRWVPFSSCHRVIRFNQIPPHRMPQTELALVLSGELALRVNDQSLRLKAGQATVIPAQELIASDPAPNICTVFWTGINPRAAFETFEDQPRVLKELEELDALIGHAAGRVLPASAALKSAVTELFELVHRNEAGSLTRIAYCMRVLDALRESLRDCPQESADALRWVQPALDLIGGDPRKPWRIDELARACRVSRTTFNRLFLDAVGVPPREHLGRMRLEKAVTLLKSTNMSVREIARVTGFSSPQYFHSRFRKHFGRRPADYRNGRGEGAPR